jgi:hypothetical protein
VSLLMTAVQITGKNGFVVLVVTAVMLFAPIIIALMTAMWPRSGSSEKAFAILRMLIPSRPAGASAPTGAGTWTGNDAAAVRALPGPVPRSGMTPRRRRTRWPPPVGYVA